MPFQYPRSDRRRCNESKHLVSTGGSGLSVSSVGSEAMQHSAVVGRADPEVKLSVSSVGSEAMQLALAVRFARGIFVFQYPRSDRRRCNVQVESLVIL